MSLAARVRRLFGGASGLTDAERCGADWRRPDGYWRCARPVGHGGRHRMQAAERSAAPPLRAVRDHEQRDGGVAAS